MEQKKKETKAQRLERIKREKDGLDVLTNIYRYAQTGEEIAADDIDRFKWYGLYTQNKNLQDIDDKTLYFMLRVKLQSGKINLKQLKALKKISREYARDTADFTTRQDIQFHFITVANLPAIFQELQEAGLSTLFAAGDVPRNVVTCPVNGVDKNQVYDVSNIVAQVNDYFYANKTLSNLPRKYKVGISGCHKHCLSHEIQDVSFNAWKVKDEILFSLCVGGGLASNKRIATHLGFVYEHHILEIVKIITIFYKDYGNRESRIKARLGHLIESWGIEKFTLELEQRLGFSLIKAIEPEYTSYEKREHFGIHEALQEGQCYLGCATNSGRIDYNGLSSLENILSRYNGAAIRTTTTQNFIVVGVNSQVAQTMAIELKKSGFDVFASVFKARTLACTGMKYCKFAISETKDLSSKLIKYLEEKFPNFEEPLSFSINGCPHSCAHPHIVDIGLLGCKVKKDGVMHSGFELILGGYLKGAHSKFGKKTGLKFCENETISAIESLLLEYQRSKKKSFRVFLEEKLDE